MKPSVSQQLLSFLQNNRGVFPSGELQRMMWRNKNGSSATPRSIVRRLQELAEEGKISVELKDGTAHYFVAQAALPPKYTIKITTINGEAVAQQVRV